MVNYTSVARGSALVVCAATFPGGARLNCLDDHARKRPNLAVLPLQRAAQRTTRVRIILVRHAESQNNASTASLLKIYRAGGTLRSKAGLELPRGRASLVQAIHEHSVPDCPLTPRGCEQAAMLGRFVTSECFQKEFLVEGGAVSCFTSPMRRTLMTTKPIAEALRVEVQCWPTVFERWGDQEMEYGSVCFTSAQIQDEFGFLTDLLPDEGPWFVASNDKENKDGFQERIGMACQTLSRRAIVAAERGCDENIIIVSHGLAIREILLQLLLAGEDPMAAVGKEGDFLGIFATPASVNTGLTVLEYRCLLGENALKLGLCMLNVADHLAARYDLRSSL